MPKALDLTGERYGNLTVIKRVANSTNGHSNWLCRCDCGNYTVVHSGHLREKNGTKTCGCLLKKAGERTYKHGKRNTRLYCIWAGIKERVLNTQNENYPLYGGRGITICQEWLGDFQAFYDWSMANGYDENAKRVECTLDRIDVNGNYEPSNCRWVDMKKQSRNRRNTIYVDCFGKKIPLSEACENHGLNYSKMKARIRRGKTFEESIVDAEKDLRGKYERKKKNNMSTV